MRFRVENLGPLREAEVDLGKDLIVLTGPNNTGKTYLAWSVYGLYSPHFKSPDLADDPVLAKFLGGGLGGVDWDVTPPDWVNIFRKVASAYEAQLHRVFASSQDVFAGVRISLDVVPQSMSAIGEGLRRAREALMAELYAEKADSSFASRVLENLLWGALLPECALFPAERIALNIFAKELVLKRSEIFSELMESALKPDPERDIRRRAGRYAWPIRDSLNTANDLANLSKNKGDFADLAEDLERAVLGGRISVSEYGELSFSPGDDAARHLPVHLTASVVKSLASLVFYFRHQAKAGDFVIIDEPELNLHPDSQRRVIRVLAKAVNRGFKIMMSTHSDYVLRELNHLVMLSDPKESVSRVIDELGYDRASILNPDKLGVYLFKDHTAHPVPVSVDGFEVETIEREIAKLNADAQAIYAARFG